MALTERALYDRREHWLPALPTRHLEAKIALLEDLLPPTATRVLDVGCGNGAITNRLAATRSVLGLDWSWEALRFVTAPRICASATALPLRPGICDVVLASELLEHLGDADLDAAVAEILRLAPHHILVSVPNDENIHINELRCPSCGHVFNASYHRRRFTHCRLSGLFPGYRLIDARVVGMPVRAYPLPLLRIRQRVGRRWFQVPPTRVVVCPACANRDFPRTGHNPVSLACDALNRLISRRHPYWLCALFARQPPGRGSGRGEPGPGGTAGQATRTRVRSEAGSQRGS